jgi:hypothetical protein
MHQVSTYVSSREKKAASAITPAAYPIRFIVFKGDAK